MSSNEDKEYSDLVQAVQLGDKVRNSIKVLMPCFSIDAIPAGAGWSKVLLVESKALSEALSRVREAFMDEFIQSEKIRNIAQAIITRIGKTFYLARKVQLLVFQDGESKFDKLVGKDDCIVLIPVAIFGSAVATVQEPKGQQGERRTSITFTTDQEFMITGRCLLLIPDQTKVVCVMLCIGKDIG